MVSVKVFSQPAAESASICKSIDWVSWEIRAYPISIIPLCYQNSSKYSTIRAEQSREDFENGYDIVLTILSYARFEN